MNYTGNIRVDWDTARPHIRTFWTNIALVNTNFCRPYIAGLGFNFTQYTGYQLFSHNMKLQAALYGQYDPDLVEWLDNWIWGVPDPTVGIDNLGYYTLFSQIDALPDNAITFPAPARNVVRSYWTGISRKRRNL